MTEFKTVPRFIMLRVVTKKEIPTSPAYQKGFWEGLLRIKEIFKSERSKDEWVALLSVFSDITRKLEAKVRSFEKEKAKLYIVYKEDAPESGVRSFRRSQ